MKYGVRAGFSYIKYSDIGCLQAKVEYQNVNANYQNLSNLGSSGIYIAYVGVVGVPYVVVRRITLCSGPHPACAS